MTIPSQHTTIPSQSFEIQNTPASQFQITTTAISDLELSCISLPSNISLSSTLTPNTRFLVTYKAVFTDKYVQALQWNIPIVSSMFLYNLDKNYKMFELRPFQGAVFSTSGITDESYCNYFILLGARHEPNCTIFVDFLLCDNEDSEKYKFCLKYSIPIIKTSQVFTADYSLFKKKKKYDAKQLNPKSMFFEKIFFLDSRLPKNLFNKLRRVIIENEGTRVSTLSEDVDFIVTFHPEEFQVGKVIHHQYILDCHENDALLYDEFYQMQNIQLKTILPNTIAVVDKNLKNTKEYINKLKSLGCTLKSVLDSRCTHYVTQSKSGGNNQVDVITKDSRAGIPNKTDILPYKVISPEWVDQCLLLLRHVKENRYSNNKPVLNLKKRLSLKKQDDIVFQFTGLPSYFKEEAIRKFRMYGIRFVDSEKFEGCTHLIMGVLNSSEKFFCSLANGSWILTPDFIQDFENQSNFEYERYEWKAKEEMNQKDKKMAESIKKWRQKIQEENRKPFYRWNVKIYSEEGKKESFKNLIVNGGGTMDDRMPITHVFVEKGYLGEVKEEKFMSTDAIFSYLFK